MKKTVTAACLIVCACFLSACAIGQDKKTVAPADMQTAPAGGQTVGTQDDGTNQDGQDNLEAVQMQGLMQGSLGDIGTGFLAYTLPQQDGEDYKLCFFKEGGNVPDFGKKLQEPVYYPLEMAYYIFPDVRQNNTATGKFKEIYFFEIITSGEDGAAGPVIIAAYDVDGRTCYDIRVYKWDGASYIADDSLMQKLNEKCRDAEEPVEEMYKLLP